MIHIARRAWCALPLALVSLAPLAQPAAPAAALAARPPQFPVRDFFRNPDRAYFRLSDDGRWLGFMQPAAIDGKPARLNVFVQRLEGSALVGEPRRLTAETARDIAIYHWKGSDTLIYEKDFGGDENFHIVAVDRDSGTVRDLTPFDGVRAQIVDALPDDPDHLLISHNKRNPEVFDVFRINVRTGAATLVAENPGNIVGWLADHQGRLRVGWVSDGLTTTLVYRDGDSGPFKPIITTDYKTSVDPQFFTADGTKMIASSNRGRDKAAIVLIDPKQPEREELVFSHPAVDVDGPVWSRARKRLTAIEYTTDRPQRRPMDDESRALWDDLAKRLPGDLLRMQGSDKAETRFIIAAFNDRTPGARYLYDAQARTLTKLGEINPRIPAAQMAPMKSIVYVSRDGLPIQGYLTLPVGREPKNLACIVNPHGGPWARDGWGYNPEVQFLANRGYCVLQMNFRGSTGYGRDFWQASFGQWGLAMQDDVTDGARWLIEQGIADPKRLGIYGASYGGYTTLAGVTFTPELYAAAVDYVGVSNLFTFMNTIPPYWRPALPRFHEMVGHPQRDEQRLRATSPALNAERIRTPLFIAQGARDPRVNKAESDQMVEALKKRGVPVQYMVKDNEGHGFANDENKFEFYEAMEAFLRQHLKP